MLNNNIMYKILNSLEQKSLSNQILELKGKLDQYSKKKSPESSNFIKG